MPVVYTSKYTKFELEIENMKMKLAIALGVLTLCIGTGFAHVQASVFPQNEDIRSKSIDQWRAHETNDYSISQIDKVFVVTGTNPDQSKFTTFIQSFKPAEGIQRLALSAEIKTEDLQGWAGLWMRIDGVQEKKLGFDNMQNRPIMGTQAWKQYQVVLDVPAETESISLGFLMSGKGKAFVRNIQFQPVNTDIPVTNILK